MRNPRDYELPGNEAIIRREGNRLIIEPLQRPSLLTFLAGCKPVTEVGFPDIDNLPSLDDVVF